MNRRGFLGFLAALTVAPKALGAAPLAPASLPLFEAPALALTGVSAWLPCPVIASIWCPKDRVILLGAETTATTPVGAPAFFGLERGKPCIIVHVSHADELSRAMDEAIARVSRDHSAAVFQDVA